MNGTSEYLNVTCLVLGIFETIIAVVSVIANGLLLIVLYKNPFKSFRRPFSVLIMGLAMTDFLKGCLPGSISIWVKFHCAVGKATSLEDDWNFYTFVDYMLDNATTILVVCFAADRLLAVAAPLFYRNRITLKKTGIVLVSVWTYAAFFSTLQFVGIPDEKYDLADSFLHIVIPMALMFSIHFAIMYNLKRRRKVETSQQLENQETPSWVRKNQRLEKNFRYVAATITLVLIVSQLPWLIVVIIAMSCNNCSSMNWYEKFKSFAGFALALTSPINPILYCWRLREYRRAVKALITCRKIMNSTSLDSTRPNENNFANFNCECKDNKEHKDKGTDLECHVK